MKNILIADPDLAARKAIKLTIKHKFGIEQVREAADMETLIRSLADYPPELLLLDWTLYGAPAPETCSLLRKAYPAMKIILLSADACDITAAQNADALFICKGDDPEHLVNIIKSLFEPTERKEL